MATTQGTLWTKLGNCFFFMLCVVVFFFTMNDPLDPFRDSKARDWLRKGKVLAPLVRPT
jgi:hypothetical protein